MKYFLALFILILVAFKLNAQTDTVAIQTSAVCETCKKTLEHDLSFEKGVKKAELDLDTKVMTVIYNSEKTTAEKIIRAISPTIAFPSES